MPRKQHQYHYLYKTTCKITGRFYYGIHSTSNLDDGYLGSGNRVRRSIYKHGKENHSIEILEFFPNRELLSKREASLITEELISDPNCMNIAYGGTGGYISISGMKRGSLEGNAKVKWLYENDKGWAIKVKQNISKSLKGRQFFKDKTHTAETKKKMSESHKGKGLGENNSQFGTMWITNGVEAKKITKSDPIPEGWWKGRQMPKSENLTLVDFLR